MWRCFVVIMLAMLLSGPAMSVPIMFPEPVSSQTEMATDQATLLAAILSSVSFAASEPQNFEASEGFPLYVSVLVSKGQPVVIPEPSTWMLCSLGLLGLGIAGRRRVR